jgi:hypothetical protein
VPRVSRAMHELLCTPVFCVHACDTLSHFKAMFGNAAPAVGSSLEGERRQSPIDAVLALYAPFIGLNGDGDET